MPQMQLAPSTRFKKASHPHGNLCISGSMLSGFTLKLAEMGPGLQDVSMSFADMRVKERNLQFSRRKQYQKTLLRKQ